MDFSESTMRIFASFFQTVNFNSWCPKFSHTFNILINEKFLEESCYFWDLDGHLIKTLQKKNLPDTDDTLSIKYVSFIAIQSLAIYFFSYVVAHLEYLFLKMHLNIDSMHLFWTWTTIQM